MRRADMLKLTGLNIDSHKNMVRRDLLPIAETDESRAHFEGWKDYDPQSAFMTLLALELAKAGTDQRGAATAVALSFSLVRKTFGVALTEQKVDVWFGIVGMTSNGVASTESVAGPLHDLRVVFEARGGKPAELMPLADIAHHAGSVALVNVSRLLRQFRQVAVENSIAIDFDWLA